MHQSIVFFLFFFLGWAAATSCLITFYFQSVCLQSLLRHCEKIMPTSFFFFFFPAEELLNNFAQQTGAWRHCLFFLSNTRNEYVMMYSLTVFEVSSACATSAISHPDKTAGSAFHSMKSQSVWNKKYFLKMCILMMIVTDPSVVHLYLYCKPLVPCVFSLLAFFYPTASLSPRTWWTKCGLALRHRTRWRFAAVCPNCSSLSKSLCPILSETSCAKSSWTLVARTGRCSTTTSSRTLCR